MSQKIRSLFFHNTLLFIGFGGAFLFFMFSAIVFFFIVLETPPKAAAVDQVIAATQSNRVLEMHIANNGLIFLKGARIQSISSNLLTVDMTWDATQFHWNVLVTPSTVFMKQDGEIMSLENLREGDTIMINGSIAGGISSWTIDAQTIRVGT